MNSIFVLPEHFTLIHIEFIHPFIKNLPVILSLLFCYITYKILDYSHIYGLPTFLKFSGYSYSKYIYFFFLKFASFFYHANFFNKLYNEIFLFIFSISYHSVNKFLDKGLFEFVGPYGIYKLIYYLFNILEPSKEIIIFFVLLLMFLFVI